MLTAAELWEKLQPPPSMLAVKCVGGGHKERERLDPTRLLLRRTPISTAKDLNFKTDAAEQVCGGGRDGTGSPCEPSQGSLRRATPGACCL